MIKKIVKYIHYAYIKPILNRYKVLRYYKGKKVEEEITVALNNIKKMRNLKLIPYTYISEYKLSTITLNKDDKYPYVFHKNKKLFLKKSLSDRKVKKTYNDLIIEQDSRSPHRYIDETFQLEKDTVLFDVGTAEGIFSLDNIDSCKHIYMFECDKEWIDILKKTFHQYMDKITIVEKFVGNRDNENFVRIDDYLSEIKETDNVFIKMDIEGAEAEALEGAQQLIKKVNNIKLAICLYHSQSDEKVISKMFDKDFILETTKGFLVPNYTADEFLPPFFRRGVIRLTKKKDKN